MPRTANAKAKPRRRLDADVARELILDATEKRLVTVGPAGIRLQEVAADIGVSHSTLLHHFGSRELLVKAVIARAVRGLHRQLIEALGRSDGEPEKIEAMVENIAKVLETSGYSRVILWLALEGQHFEVPEVSMSDVVDAAHAMRLERNKQARKGSKRPTREDTARIVVLATVAIVAGSVLLPNLLQHAGLSADSSGQARFRSWLTRLLVSHIDA